MKTEELRAIQAPLKNKYREDPKAAMITLRADGKIGEGISCKIETGRAMAKAGLHPATGGNGMLACSGDLLLEALVACAGVTLSAVATAIGVFLVIGPLAVLADLVVWVEALDGGDLRNKATHRDRLLMLKAPFTTRSALSTCSRMMFAYK